MCTLTEISVLNWVVQNWTNLQFSKKKRFLQNFGEMTLLLLKFTNTKFPWSKREIESEIEFILILQMIPFLYFTSEMLQIKIVHETK